MNDNFKLVRYFSITSFIAITIAALILGLLYRQTARSDLLEMVERNNITRAQSVADHFWSDIEPLFHELEGLNRETLRAHPNTKIIRDFVSSGLEEHFSSLAGAVKIKIFNPLGMTLFSTLLEEIGEDKSDSESLIMALGNNIFSKLAHKETFDTFKGSATHLDLIETYVPISHDGPDTPIEAVFELYYDVTFHIQRMERTQKFVTLGVALVLLGVYGVLYLIVVRADRIIEKSGKVLRESERRFRSVTQSTTDAIVSIDDQGNFFFWNKAAIVMFGYEEHEILGKPVTTIIPERYFDAHLKGFDSLISGKAPKLIGTAIEVTARHKDGGEFPIEMTLSKWEAEGRSFFSGIIRNITKRKESEAALKDSESRFRLVTDAMPALMAYVDSDMRYRFNNKAYEEWFHMPREEMLGRGIKDVVGEDIFEETKEYIAKALSGEKVNFEAERPDVNGVNRVVEGTFIPHFNEDGEVAGYYSLTTDITQRKENEMKRTALERELQHASKLEAVGQLAGGIAHEINTPTQYIGDNIRFLEEAFGDIKTVVEAYRGLAQSSRGAGVLLEETAKVDAAEEEADLEYLLEEIPQATAQGIGGVEQVARIVLAMKEFSHPSSKEKAPVDLNKAIETTITVCRNEWKYVADVNTDLDAALPPVMCLAGEMNQVLLNLIVNAAHAIEPQEDGHKGQINISSRHNDGWAEIRVSDTGSGIPEEVRNSIFDPFFTTKEVGKGTGQGLTICHDIVVNKHRGNITFETIMDEGTTFLIRLPVEGRVEDPDEP